jgi:hypothetical protein
LSDTPRVLGQHTRAFAAVLEAAQEILRKTFGMELVLLRPKGTGNGSGAGGGDGGNNKKAPPTNLYVLRSTLDAKVVAAAASIASEVEDDEDEDDDHVPRGRDTADLQEWQRDEGAVLEWKKADQRALMGILHVILSLILVNGRILGDGMLCPSLFYGKDIPNERPLTDAGELHKHLRRLGLSDSTVLPLDPSAAHPGTVTLGSYLNVLQRQGYLEKTKSSLGARMGVTQQPNQRDGQQADDQSAEWRWGARAELEIGEKSIVQGFIGEIYKSREREGADGAEGAAAARKAEQEASKSLLKRVAQAAGGPLQDAKAPAPAATAAAAAS